MEWVQDDLLEIVSGDSTDNLIYLGTGERDMQGKYYLETSYFYDTNEGYWYELTASYYGSYWDGFEMDEHDLIPIKTTELGVLVALASENRLRQVITTLAEAAKFTSEEVSDLFTS